MRHGMLAVMAVLALTAPVVAQPTPATQKADALFNEGRELLEAGKFEAACARFQASLDAADALGTRLNLALCMEKRGLYHSAVEKYDDTARRAEGENQPESAKVAREHADKLRPLVPTVTIKVAAVPGQKVTISRSDAVEVEVDWNRPVPVDPTDPSDPDDTITISAQAPGYAAWRSEPLTIAAKGAATVTVPALTPIGDPDPRPVPAGGTSHKKLYGIISASAGVVLIGVSALWANSLATDLTHQCAAVPAECMAGDDDYDGEAHDIWKKQRYYATSIFAAGIVAVGVGAYLYFTAPSNPTRETTAVVPTVGPDGGGFAVLGHF